MGVPFMSPYESIPDTAHVWLLPGFQSLYDCLGTIYSVEDEDIAITNRNKNYS